jgi:polyhydroxybutyrate depolymerase
MRSIATFFFIVLIGGTFAQTTVDSLLTADGYRTYRVHTPPGFQPSEHLPLVLNLHGVGSNNAQQEVYSGMNAVADAERFVVVYPNGVNSSWNLGLGTVDEYGFFTALLDTLAVTYGINTERTYACGMSQGGYMSFVLACALYERIAAIASVAGSMALGLDLFCAPTRPVPVMMVHGTADGIVPYTGGIQSLAVPSVIAFWVAHNGCDPVPVITPIPNSVPWDLCTAVREDHGNGELGSAVALIRVEGGGHTWPGSAIPVGVTNQDISASQAIWEFFEGHSLSGALSVPIPAAKGPGAALLPSLFDEHTELRNDGSEQVNVTVTDAMGRLVLRAVVPANSSQVFHTAAWDQGYYIWTVQGGSGTRVLRSMLLR